MPCWKYSMRCSGRSTGLREGMLSISYDVPLKASGGKCFRESAEVYQFMVCAVCLVDENYELGIPE